MRHHILNLHSIMLLLYQIGQNSYAGAYLSTFHYASTLSDDEFPEAPAFFIYIPLCFYFIPFLFSPLISCSSILYFVHLLF